MEAQAEPADAAPDALERRGKTERPELFSLAAERLSFMERLNIRLVRATFTSAWLDRLMRFLQRTVGAGWIDLCTRKIRVVHGLDRLPPPERAQSFILVANHRSFFDMFVVNAVLYRSGWRTRLLFPVRAGFFYDSPLGFLVNGIMSFYSMYPPIFRERKKSVLNHTAMSELILALKHGGRSAGIHPEGTRKKDDDPYTFLPAQSGVGRAIHGARVDVIPVFINGLGNDLKKQVWGNFNGKGRKIIVNFGAPIAFGALLDEPPTAKTYRSIADKTLEVIGALGQEEKALRAEMDAGR